MNQLFFYAVNANNDYLGFDQLYPSFSSVSVKRTWVLNDLYIKENARKLGVARELMLQAHKLAVETGANAISLETAPDNIKAQNLYKSLGYKLESHYQHYFLSV